jgi:hypothetical protein
MKCFVVPVITGARELQVKVKKNIWKQYQDNSQYMFYKNPPYYEHHKYRPKESATILGTRDVVQLFLCHAVQESDQNCLFSILVS